MNYEENFSLIEEVAPDLEGFLDIGNDPDCEEQTFTLQGREVPYHGNAE